MTTTLNRDSAVPLYLQLADELRTKILSGEWQPEQRIPSENELNQIYSISRMTIRQVLGKLVGIFGSTFLMARFTRAELDDDIAWSDLFGLSLLAGVGFTVSLLIGELAFGAGSIADEHVKIGVLIGSLIAALLATIVLRSRNKIYARIHDDETRDDDLDGIPDVYQRGPGRGGAATTDGNRTLG